MKKHAFLIMAHNNFSILERLMLLLDTPYNDIFIHIDKKAKSIDINRLQSICTKAHVFITKRYNVTWGSSKQVRAELNLFQTACKYGPYWYYHLCSGCDLPIKTATEIYKFFEKNRSNYLFYNEKLTKYDYERLSTYRNIFKKDSILSFLNPYINLLQLKLKIDRTKMRPLTHYPILKRGWNWCDLTQEAVNAIIEAKHDIIKFTRYTVCSDEMYKQIILLNRDIPIYKENDSDGVRFIDWSDGGGDHPKIFRINDYNRIMSSDKLFARKFDENIDSEIINQIYKTLISHENRDYNYL